MKFALDNVDFVSTNLARWDLYSMCPLPLATNLGRWLEGLDRFNRQAVGLSLLFHSTIARSPAVLFLHRLRVHGGWFNYQDGIMDELKHLLACKLDFMSGTRRRVR